MMWMMWMSCVYMYVSNAVDANIAFLSAPLVGTPLYQYGAGKLTYDVDWTRCNSSLPEDSVFDIQHHRSICLSHPFDDLYYCLYSPPECHLLVPTWKIPVHRRLR